MCDRWLQVFTFLCMSAVLVPALADSIERHEPEIDMFATMAGYCSKLRIDNRDFSCTTVAFSHSPGGRSGFTVPLMDSEDDAHIVTFSGENGKRGNDNRYELLIDRMLLKSKDRPKQDGLPVPLITSTTGMCEQVGNFAMQQVSTISCTASDGEGKKYELQFKSDGTPIRIQMIRSADPAAEERRAKILSTHISQLRCRQMADLEGILPRDRTGFILKCMED